MERRAEPELMDLPDEVRAYAEADFAEVNDRFVERLVELAGKRDDASALDLGCGPGDIALRVARARPRWRILAADASQPMLDRAAGVFERGGVTPRVTTRRLDAKDTRLPDVTFDVVYSNSLLHHLTDATAMWREVARVVRPGATIFVRDLYRPASEVEARRLVEAHAGAESVLLQEEFHRSLLSAYLADEIRVQLEQAGLAHLTVETVTDRHIDIFGVR